MRISVNGETREIEDGATIAQLLERVQPDSKHPLAACAVEVNRSLVPRRLHAEQRLAPEDAVEIVTLVGGG